MWCSQLLVGWFVGLLVTFSTACLPPPPPLAPDLSDRPETRQPSSSADFGGSKSFSTSHSRLPLHLRSLVQVAAQRLPSSDELAPELEPEGEAGEVGGAAPLLVSPRLGSVPSLMVSHSLSRNAGEGGGQPSPRQQRQRLERWGGVGWGGVRWGRCEGGWGRALGFGWL